MCDGYHFVPEAIYGKPFKSATWFTAHPNRFAVLFRPKLPKLQGTAGNAKVHQNGATASKEKNSVSRLSDQMTKAKRRTEMPPSPMSLTCPFCKAKPGEDCATGAGGFSALHVARIKAAAISEAKP